MGFFSSVCGTIATANLYDSNDNKDSKQKAIESEIKKIEAEIKKTESEIKNTKVSTNKTHEKHVKELETKYQLKSKADFWGDMKSFSNQSHKEN